MCENCTRRDFLGATAMMTLLHRVVFYGDHVQSARHLADLMRMELIEEG